MAPVSWLRGWGARRGNMDGRRMRLYKGAGRPGRTHTWGRETRGFIGILVPKYPWGPKISMGGGPISGEIGSHCPSGAWMEGASCMRRLGCLDLCLRGGAKSLG